VPGPAKTVLLPANDQAGSIKAGASSRRQMLRNFFTLFLGGMCIDAKNCVIVRQVSSDLSHFFEAGIGRAAGVPRDQIPSREFRVLFRWKASLRAAKNADDTQPISPAPPPKLSATSSEPASMNFRPPSKWLPPISSTIRHHRSTIRVARSSSTAPSLSWSAGMTTSGVSPNG